MMANAEHAELKSSLSEENEASQSLTELETNTQTLEGNEGEKCNYILKPSTLMHIIVLLFTEANAMSPSFGDERCLSVESAEGTETQEKRIMDEKISPIERQLEYLLNKADEFQKQLLWR